jgi:hypothetical protein
MRVSSKQTQGYADKGDAILRFPLAARELRIAELRQVRAGENAMMIFHAAKTSNDEMYLETVIRSMLGRPVQKLHGPRFRGDRTQELKFFRAWH